jgi:hypothetical protein
LSKSGYARPRTIRPSSSPQLAFLRARQQRSEAILLSAHNNGLRRLNIEQIREMRNPRRVGRETLSAYVNKDRSEFLSNVADFLEDRMKRPNAKLEKNVNTNQSLSNAAMESTFTKIAMNAEMVLGQLIDIDGNPIYFDQHDHPYIIVSDFENHITYRVYVELFAIRIMDPSKLSHCTFENTDGMVEVIATRVTPSLTKGGSYQVID